MRNSAVKIGPFWDRAEFDLSGKVIKRWGRSILRFDELKQLWVREYFAPYEEEQLLGAHPEVQKAPRNAELWAETKDGRRVRLASLETAGLLLAAITPVSEKAGIPLGSERAHIG